MAMVPPEFVVEFLRLNRLVTEYAKARLLLQLAAINKQCALLSSMVADSVKQEPWYSALESIQEQAYLEKKNALSAAPSCKFRLSPSLQDDANFINLLNSSPLEQQQQAFRHFFGSTYPAKKTYKDEIWHLFQDTLPSLIYPNPSIEGLRIFLLRLAEGCADANITQERRYKLDNLYYAYRRYCQGAKLEQHFIKPVLQDMMIVDAIKEMSFKERNDFATHLLVWAQDNHHRKEEKYAPIQSWRLGKARGASSNRAMRLLEDFNKRYTLRLLSEGNAWVFLIEPRATYRGGERCILKISQMLSNPDFVLQLEKYRVTIRPFLNIPMCNKAVSLEQRVIDEGLTRRRLIVEAYYPQGSISDYIISLRRDSKDVYDSYLICISLFKKVIAIYSKLQAEGILFLDAKIENWFVDGERLVIGDMKSFRGSYNASEFQEKFKGLDYDSITTYPYIPPRVFFTKGVTIEKMHAYLLGVQLFCALLLMNEQPEEPQDELNLQAGAAYLSGVFSGVIGEFFQGLIQKLTRVEEQATL